MEHNELDDIFRKQIQGDDSDLSAQELQSKQNIWEALEKPQRVRVFHFWKIAAAVLLLLLGGSSWIFSNKINQQEAQILNLEKNYNKIFTSLEKVEKELENQVPTPLVTEPKTIENPTIASVSASPQINIIEKKIYVYDTVWVEKDIFAAEKIQFIRDTVFVEIEVEQPKEAQDLRIAEKDIEEELKEKDQPSKVEFVFGKKPLKKPAQERNSIFLKTEVAKKPNFKNNGLIIFPFKN